MDQLSWGSLSPQAYYKPTPSLKEINDSTATIVMDYMISAKNDNNETELYAVSEYYRMLYTEERIRLLDFERTVNEVFIRKTPALSPPPVSILVSPAGMWNI